MHVYMYIYKNILYIYIHKQSMYIYTYLYVHIMCLAKVTETNGISCPSYTDTV